MAMEAITPEGALGRLETMGHHGPVPTGQPWEPLAETMPTCFPIHIMWLPSGNLT